MQDNSHEELKVVSTEEEAVEEAGHPTNNANNAHEDQEAKSHKSEEQSFKDKFYYLAAEFENTKKRYDREKLNLIKFGSENILRDILSSVDLFDLTVLSLANDQDQKIKNVVVGLDMIRKQMVESLHKHGLEKIQSLGKPFDPNFHEAVAQEFVEGAQPNTVIKEHQSGYMLNGRLLRAAKVVVSSSGQ